MFLLVPAYLDSSYAGHSGLAVAHPAVACENPGSNYTAGRMCIATVIVVRSFGHGVLHLSCSA